MKQDFLDMMLCLSESGADFLIVGAHAMAVFGYTRATGDVDLFVRASPENSQKVWKALEAFGAPLSIHGVKEDFFSMPGSVYQIGIPPSRIDVLSEISGVSFDEAYGDSVEAELGGLKIRVLSLKHLIQNKLASGREKDLLDAKELQAIRGEK